MAAIASAYPAIIVPETLDPINRWACRRARGAVYHQRVGVAKVWSRRGCAEAIAVNSDADETLKSTDGDGWR